MPLYNTAAATGTTAVLSTVIKTTTYTLTTADDIVLADGTTTGFTVTLPSAVGITKRFTIKKIDKASATIAIGTTSNQTIDGYTTLPTLRNPNQDITLVSNGSNWVTVNSPTQLYRTVYASEFGAFGDAQNFSDAVTTAGSTTLTSAGATFVNADIGKTIIISNASANASLTTALASGATITSLAITSLTTAIGSGATFVLGYGATTQTYTTSAAAAAGATSLAVTSTVTNAVYAIGSPVSAALLSTTIVSIASTTAVVLAVAAGSTTTGQVYIYGTDCTTPLQNALNSLSYFGKGVNVKLTGGKYLVIGTLNLVNGSYITGEGIGTTILIKHSLAENFISMQSSGAGLSALGFSNLSTPTSGSAISVTATNCEIYDINIAGAFNGIFAQTGSNVLRMDKILMSSYVSVGLLVDSTQDIYISNFVFTCSSNTAYGQNGGIRLTNRVEAFMAVDGDIFSGVYSLTMDAGANTKSNRPEYNQFTNVDFDSAQLGSTINNSVLQKFTGCWFSSVTANSGLTLNICDDISLVNCMIVNNWSHGLVLSSAATVRTKVIGCSIIGNNVGNNGSNGIAVAAATDFIFMGNTATNGLGFVGLQAFGININSGASDRYIILNNLLSGNASGGLTDNGTGVNKQVSDVNGLLPGSPLKTIVNLAATQTTVSTTAVQVTGLTTTITAYANHYNRLKVFMPQVQISVIGSVTFTLWRGVVGSGTQIGSCTRKFSTAAVFETMEMEAFDNPTAGSYTYNVGWFVSTGTGTLQQATTSPTFIATELL